MSPWLILGVLFFARTAMGFQFQSVAAVSPLLVADLGIDLALLGVLIGVWMLPGVVAAIPGGMLGRSSPRWWPTGSMIAASLRRWRSWS